MVNQIFHIAEVQAWSDAQADGDYRQSTIGRTLDDDGFIHCSRFNQVEVVANAAYRGRRDLLLLVIDPTKVGAEIRDENLDGGSDLFPHIYGPLNLDAVVEVRQIPVGPDGRFVF
jgi:glutathione S-transferase